MWDLIPQGLLGVPRKPYGYLLVMSWGFDGQREIKAGAVGRIIGGRELATVGFHDGAADAKPHPCPVKLGGEERIEYLVSLLRRKSYAIVAN